MFSADRAAHSCTSEGDANIISFNMLIINRKMLQKVITSTQSHEIITLMQVAGSESSDISCTLFKLMLMEQKNFNRINLPYKYHHIQFEFFDINDAKMLYALFQHSSFTRLSYAYF